MSVLVSESCLTRNYHRNKKYFTNETKREREARIKHEKYANNRDVLRLKASKRYYENRLEKITDNDKKQDIMKKIEELENRIEELSENTQ